MYNERLCLFTAGQVILKESLQNYNKSAYDVRISVQDSLNSDGPKFLTIYISGKFISILSHPKFEHKHLSSYMILFLRKKTPCIVSFFRSGLLL